MRSTEERLALLHRRVRELQRRRDKALLVLQGSGSAGLMTALIVMVRSYSGNAEMASLYAGATLFDENTGGYVLVAVIAFMTGTLLTAFLIRHRNPSGSKHEEKEHGKEEKHM